MAASIESDRNGVVRVSGELDFTSVPMLLETSAAIFDGQSPLVLDLEGVSRANSAGLVLVLEWLSRARENKRELRIRHMPRSLREIAEVSNVGELLPVEPD